jgi:hypothetical protein
MCKTSLLSELLTERENDAEIAEEAFLYLSGSVAGMATRERSTTDLLELVTGAEDNGRK